MNKLGEVVWRLIYRRNENLNKKKKVIMIQREILINLLCRELKVYLDERILI